MPAQYAKIPRVRRTKFGQTNGNQSGRGEIECLAFEYIIHAPGDRNGSCKGRPVITVKALLEENNIISLRTAYVVDDGNLVGFQLMPAWLGSSIPGSKPKGFDWASQDFTWLYRHMRSVSDEKRLMHDFPCVDQDIKPIVFEKPPVFRLLWTDSGNSVALYLNEEPWAFIEEESHQGYSKGILKPKVAHLPAVGNLWNQELFEKTFEIGRT